MERLLVVEDDAVTAAFLKDNLEADGYSVAAATSVDEALRAIEVRGPALVILDVVLDGSSGLALLDRVRHSAGGGARRVDPDLPVLVLSGRSAEVDRLRGFSRGADDYLVKPFSYPELVARVRAVLRRTRQRTRRDVLAVDDLVVDPAARTVCVAGRPIELSAKEFGLLYALAVQPERVVPKGELLRDVWGYQALGLTRTVDAHACRLRRKLGPGYVLNVRGVGYRLLKRGAAAA